MTVAWTIVALTLLPLAGWLLAIAVVAGRRAWRRRGDESARRLRLARMLGRRELVMIPTADVDLPESAVLEVADAAGFRFLGYERPDTLLSRRVGVFVRAGGSVDVAIRRPARLSR
ncbi:hypothetical protein NCCP2495_15390 [Dietzia sp. NCCP-2495]|uniref:hypothetical protein n=1 Tax=Dietzia sp. NCCP-2495 TaxID=2934675 RepID=UPI00223023BA|nr:hypothetical protein [Dietzia sp. NCCP-2495]GLB63660.1 hypothetical protein NCCP2495_15390 [Dietzia sp. NCCP-2495]